MTDHASFSSNQRVIDHLDEVVDSLRYRPVATTAMQMRQAADEIQRLWREHDEDVERMERAADEIERLREANKELKEAVERLIRERDTAREALRISEQRVREHWPERDRLRAALEKSADTFADFNKGLRLLNRPLLADACEIAEKAAREAISGIETTVNSRAQELFAALSDFLNQWKNRGETTSLHEWHERMKASAVQAEAVLNRSAQERP